MQFDPARVLQKLKATYWFIPSCTVTLAVALSFLMPWLDQRYSIDPTSTFGWIGQTQTDGARAVLVAIAGSIIGVAGTTFSITIVAVSFASSNFGPRLLANFMRDRGNQLTLGTFIATFVYCLLVLRRVHGAASDSGSVSYDAFVPHFSVIVALVLALACVGVLIYFIHHVPETINIDRLVAQIGRRLKKSVTSLFPISNVLPERTQVGCSVDWSKRTSGRLLVPILAREAGFVQGVDFERLGKLADEHDILLRIHYRPGDFVVEGDMLIDLFLKKESLIGGKVPEGGVVSLSTELRNCYAMGFQRTAHQDCLFLADQLVEVIARAMSPGVNDPFTAITCLGWLKGALIEFVVCDAEQESTESESIHLKPIDFERMVATVFDQTRQYICGDRDVALHAMTVLTEIGARTQCDEHRNLLRRRMDELAAACSASLEAAVGASDVAKRYTESIALLDDPDALDRQRDGTGWLGGSG